jgi:hypothetical protein
MEDWTAASSEPKEFSQVQVQGCDLCILRLYFAEDTFRTDSGLVSHNWNTTLLKNLPLTP